MITIDMIAVDGCGEVVLGWVGGRRQQVGGDLIAAAETA
jgi:hypothetical protein